MRVAGLQASRASLALWVAALITSLAGCGSNPPTDLQTEMRGWADEIPRIVPDSSRAAVVRSSYERLADVLTSSAEERRMLAAEWRGFFRRYDAPRQSLEDLGARQQRSAERMRVEALEAREQVRAHTTEKEWKALASSRKRLAKHYTEARP
jgi:DNA repair ATPase RecN